MSPSFSVKSLLDKFPGEIEIQTEELCGYTSSKYYTPNEFIDSNLPKNQFSIFHINIISLQKHITELKSLLDILNHPFDIIAVTETKLKKNAEIIKNIDIPNFNFVHTSTESNSGGAGIYIKNTYNYEVIKNLSLSAKGIAESIFIELNNNINKSILIGNIYRHPSSSLHTFNRDFLSEIMAKIAKIKKLCILTGDWNADILQIDNDNNTCEFFEILSTFSFKPLILQPTRVTLSSSTLIDNIFLNNIEMASQGGNITTSLSDHFCQFTIIDCFDHLSKTKKTRLGRSFKNFNHDEFKRELININWESLFLNKDAEICFNSFFNKVEDILNLMAPIKNLSKKEIKLQEKPWITSGLLKSMKSRDKLHKAFVKEVDPIKKTTIFNKYKTKRNMILKLLRVSKDKYYEQLFLENKNNLKETWKNIRKIVNINKKSNTSPQS